VDFGTFLCLRAVTELSPNSITPTFTETSMRGKSWTQGIKVADAKGDKS